MKTDLITKDSEAKDIDITEGTISYIRSISFLKDVYCNDEIKSQKVIETFFYEIQATLVGLIGGINRKSRNIGINQIFSYIDLMKHFILRALNTIDNENNR